jgi:flavin-dependent dehydrogenase
VQPEAPDARKRIVIVGAGFGGVAAARALKRCDADVVVIDRRNHHIFQPLLYQVATALPQMQNRMRVQTQWFWSYFTGQRGARLIPERAAAPSEQP